jgi:hypothetical protein
MLVYTRGERYPFFAAKADGDRSENRFKRGGATDWLQIPTARF